MILTKVTMFTPLAQKWGRLNGIPTELVLAIIHQESGGNPNSKRFEPAYLQKYSGDTKFKEIHITTGLSPQDIATSYGLMQIMPMTAWGYLSSYDKTPNLIKVLTDPSSNIRYCTSFLKTLISKNNGDLALAIKSYNGTGPAAERYSKNVIALSREYRTYLDSNGD